MIKLVSQSRFTKPTIEKGAAEFWAYVDSLPPLDGISVAEGDVISSTEDTVTRQIIKTRWVQFEALEYSWGENGEIATMQPPSPAGYPLADVYVDLTNRLVLNFSVQFRDIEVEEEIYTGSYGAATIFRFANAEQQDRNRRVIEQKQKEQKAYWDSLIKSAKDAGVI